MPDNSHGYEPIGDATHQLLDLNAEDTECHLFGYQTSTTRKFIHHLFCVLFVGLPYVAFSWFPSGKLLKLKKCSLKQANVVLVTDNHANFNLIEIKTDSPCRSCISMQPLEKLRYFYYRHTKFVWVQHLDNFATIDYLIPSKTCDQYLSETNGLFDYDYIDLLKLYGPNTIEIELKSYWALFCHEVFNPFYVFQAFSVILWCFDHYYIYAICVVILTLFSIVTSLIQTRRQSEALHDLVNSAKCQNVQVLRQNLLSETTTSEIDPSELVPGDLIILPKSDFIIPCDCVLLTGECIVNESMLTGESVPITKTALHESSEVYSISTHKRNTLFAGTHLIQRRYYGGQHVLARVVQTGFDTTKGALVKSILFQTPTGLQFYKDSLKFVFALFFIATIGMGYCLYLYILRHAPLREIIIRSLDIITIVVPPALPAAMTVGEVYSQNRLRKLGIYCISPSKINVCGKLKLACFDKTGTLTQDGLDMHSVLPAKDGKFSEEPVKMMDSLDNRSKIVQAMVCCHSITRIEGEITGDPLDLTMFEFTGWELEEPGDDENARFDMIAPSVVKPAKSQELHDDLEMAYQIGIIKQFAFSSTLQCMSVLARDLTASHMTAFAKGAPEKIATMCQAESIPDDFNAKLSEYTAKGYRVIALASKNMPKKFSWKDAQKAKRNLIECDLTFLGLLIMQNTLKPQTTPIIRILHRAQIRTVMITGDNILTAISVARDCEMIQPNEQLIIIETNENDSNALPQLKYNKIASQINDNHINIATSYHFAIDGKTYTKIKTFYPDMLPTLLVRCTIFARFQPDQKTQLITYFQSLDYVVSMVGDGANDCGALKAANIGVSLSQAEASVAAPFTSSIQDISCLIHLMLEGRCALVTSFAVFKYMAMYSLIQFTTVLILYKSNSGLGDMQFLFIDLIITTSLAVTIGRQGPSGHLGTKRPPGSLVAASNLIPIALQIILTISVQVAALYYLREQKWYEPVPLQEQYNEETIQCWENTVLFTVSCFQYVILAFVYAKGRPYREMLIRNFWFLFCALSLTCFQIYLLIMPSEKVADLFELIYLPRKHTAKEQIEFRYKLMVLPFVHFFLANVIEVAIADRGWLKKVVHFVRRKKMPKNKYKLLLEECLTDFEY